MGREVGNTVFNEDSFDFQKKIIRSAQTINGLIQKQERETKLELSSKRKGAF